MTKKIAVLLSGCGNMDGAEINEVVLTLLNIDANNAKAFMFAPNITFKPIDHYTKKLSRSETRNVLHEAARLARGDIWPLNTLKVEEFDALIIPGGAGVGKNLSNLFDQGIDCDVNFEAQNVILEFFRAGKPIGALCIAPLLVAKVLQPFSPELKVTLGQIDDRLQAIGVQQEECPVNGIIIDEKNKIVSTPAFMLDARFSQINDGIAALMAAVVRLC